LFVFYYLSMNENAKRLRKKRRMQMSRLQKKVTCLLVVSLVLLITMDVSARTFTLKNSSGASRTIHYLPGGNTWSIANGGSVNVSIADGTAAIRFWSDYGQQSPPCNSLAEWTLNGAGNQDFYDVSFVDGYNLAILIQPSGGTGGCGAPGKTSAMSCPAELLKSGSCCSACMVFNTDQYCCRGSYGTPATCPPTSYSLVFHNYCTNCYSYAYDDTAATFTCTNANYTITWGAAAGSGGGGSTTTTAASSTTTTASSTSTTASGSITTTSGGGGVTTIQAENYSAMSGVITEACSEGGLNVGSIDTGDWMVYPVNVATAKSYLFKFRVSSIYSGKILRVDYNAGANVVGQATIPLTGGWQTWTTCTMSGLLPAGSINLGINAVSGGFNINWFSFE
jgi:hypothetical protein